MQSVQLLLVVFYLGYDLPSERLQLLRMASLSYNKQYSHWHYYHYSPLNNDDLFEFSRSQLQNEHIRQLMAVLQKFIS